MIFIIMNIGDHLPLIKGVFLVAMLDEPAAVTLWFINMIMLFYLCAPAPLWIKRKSLTLLLNPIGIAGCRLVLGASGQSAHDLLPLLRGWDCFVWNRLHPKQSGR
ncbi:hypothetical protein [Rhizobium gallicum]|uniref:hypothetical protein n=1 Tax=Rhizobium gallicum TaxID=56730 RepID=UPI001EF8B6F4|nr:hypothetical protein [Rhizobium gallicum]ULJ75100.1 hypothetical protein L2W42_33040 [Rhizobium gallicum]